MSPFSYTNMVFFLRKNALISSKETAVYQQLSLLQESCKELLSDENLTCLARESGFIKRARKITAPTFVKALIKNTLPQRHQSLIDLKADFLKFDNEQISKVAVHNKFNSSAVVFMYSLLNQFLTDKLSELSSKINSNKFFRKINIKDSSKFKLPLSFLEKYPSYGSFNKQASLMNLQFEYDILSGHWNCIELTQATRNDQRDSKETRNRIKEAELYIRDLGYITINYLTAVCKANAYFLNRLPKIGVYLYEQGKYKVIDWKKLDKQMKSEATPVKELEVYIGQKEKIKCRLIITPVPNQEVSKRIRKASQGGKRKKGYNLSDEYKIKAKYNLFITNIPENEMDSRQVIDAYKLRWQIELIFKTWKSNLQIHEMKPVKTERMECQLLAKLIWITINTKLHYISQELLLESQPEKEGSSIYKFLKLAIKFSESFFDNLSTVKDLVKWFNSTIVPILKDLAIEKRNNKPTHYQIFVATINSLN